VLAQGSWGALSTSNVECCEEEIIFSSLESNGEFNYIHHQVQPVPPPDLPLLPSNYPNQIMMDVVKDETQAHGSEYTQLHVLMAAVKDEAHSSKYTWSHVLVAAARDAIQAHGPKYTQFPVFQTDLSKVDGYTLGMIDGYMPMKINCYAQGFQLFKIFCVTKSIALLLTVFGMLTPLPFDRGKVVSCLSMFCPHAVSLLLLSKPYQVGLVHLSLPPWRAPDGYCSNVIPYFLWGVENKSMGSDNMQKIHLVWTLAYHSEHLHPNPT